MRFRDKNHHQLNGRPSIRCTEIIVNSQTDSVANCFFDACQSLDDSLPSILFPSLPFPPSRSADRRALFPFYCWDTSVVQRGYQTVKLLQPPLLNDSNKLRLRLRMTHECIVFGPVTMWIVICWRYAFCAFPSFVFSTISDDLRETACRTCSHLILPQTGFIVIHHRHMNAIAGHFVAFSNHWTHYSLRLLRITGIRDCCFVVWSWPY